MSAAEHEEEIRSLLSDLPPGKGSALLHLLSCPNCRERAIDQLREAQEPEETPDYEGMWGRLHAKVPWMIEEALRRKAETEGLLEKLLSRPRDLRVKTLLEEIKLEPEELLEAAEVAQLRDPERAVALADVALQVAGRFLREEGAETARTLQCARASVLKGNAYRVMGNLTLADDAMARAAYFLSWPLDLYERGVFCRAWGLVRWEQGRLDEAEGMLRQAALAFGERCASQEEGASWVLCGLLCLERNRVGMAIRLLQKGREALDPAARPWLTVRAGLGLALALVEIGQKSRALAVLNDTFRHYGRVRDEREQVRMCWLEGRLLAKLGQRQEAEQLLAAARGKLMAEYSLAESVVCSLDLAVVLVEAGRAAEVPRLIEEIEAIFLAELSALDITRRVWHQLVAETDGGQDLMGRHVAAAASTLRRVLRARGYRVESLPFT